MGGFVVVFLVFFFFFFFFFIVNTCTANVVTDAYKQIFETYEHYYFLFIIHARKSMGNNIRRELASFIQPLCLGNTGVAEKLKGSKLLVEPMPLMTVVVFLESWLLMF